MIDPATSQEIQALIASLIKDSCEPGEDPTPIQAAIMQARVPEEVEYLARAMIARTRSLPGGMGLRGPTQIKRIRDILGA